MHIETFFDPRTFTLTYVVSDPASRDAVVIDPVLDYDANRVSVSEESNQKVLAHLAEKGLTLRAILETHAHADHLSGSQGLKVATGAPIVIGQHITGVQAFFAAVFNLDVAVDGSQFDKLLTDGETWSAGSLTVKAIATPGHTPACMTYEIGGALFTGDTLFMPDFGTGRCDFPNGSAEQLFDSIQKLYRSYPDDTRVFVGHDYQPEGRPLAFETTIGASKAGNKQVRVDTERAQFVAWRTARDATLNLPNLIFPSIQVNVDAGRLPVAESNGRRYLKLPINLFG